MAGKRQLLSIFAIVAILIGAVAGLSYTATDDYRPMPTAKAYDWLHSMGFDNPMSWTPFMSTAWIKEIENLPVPTAYWPMWEGADTNIEDIAGGNDLTLSNAVAWKKTGNRLVGSDLVANGGFEDFTGTADDGITDDVDDWTEDDSDDGCIDEDTANESAGTYCVELNRGATASTNVTLTQTLSSLTVGERYHVYFKAMSDGTGTGTASITGIGGASDAVADTDNTMTWFEFEFVATGTNHDLVIASETAGGSIFCDEVSAWHQADDAFSSLPLSSHMVETTPIEEFYRYGTTYYASITGTPVQAAGDLNFDGATAGTWMGWFYPRDDGQLSFGRLISKDGAFDFYMKSTDELNIRLWDSGGQDDTLTTSSPLTANQWTFIAVVYDGTAATRLKIYAGDLTGTLTLQTTGALNIEAALVDAGNDVYIGTGFSRAFNGLTAHIIIDNGTAYTENQIRLWQRLTGGMIQGVAPRS